MEDEGQVSNDRQRAEVFDALGHPTRIVILKALGEGALGFADLKKKTAIDSSGHLQHHLTKLNGLIKTDEYGKYCLSDQGKDALLTVQTVENVSMSRPKDAEKSGSRRFNSKMVLKSVSLLLVALLIASSAIALIEYNQTEALQKENSFFKAVDPEAAAYYQFGVTLIANVNSSFTPPISMYQGLLIGLQADGWNKASLQGFTVYITLMPWETFTNTTGGGGVPNNDPIGGNMTSPPTNYSDVYSNGVIYRYVWQIDIEKSGVKSIPPWDLILVDAATGAIVPHGLLF
jgi:DNA-binding HxlR family transcriptional regulator